MSNLNFKNIFKGGLIFFALSLVCTILITTGSAFALSEKDTPKVMVGGHSIGVLMNTVGVNVVGFSPVIDENGKEHFPARESGIEIGDTILEVNDVEVKNDEQLKEILMSLKSNKNDIKMLVEKNQEKVDVMVKPALCSETHSYRIGLYVTDETSGIGTLSFYEPKTRNYGALGHKVTADNLEKDDLEKGEVFSCLIKGLKKSEPGVTGQKQGNFVKEDQYLNNDSYLSGSVYKNNVYGIFGKLENNPVNKLFPEPVEIMQPEKAKLGHAQIVTVLNGNKLELFDIDIEKIFLNGEYTGKGMVIKVTDDRLLEATGGIIQGMSGSPIIQDGKLVGAISHVFVNNPQKGYATFAEWMYNSCKNQDK